MLLSYRDSGFWERFQTRNWQPRVPTVLRNPFKAFPFSDEMVLRAMKRFHADMQSGNKRFRYMLSHGSSTKPARRALRDLFKHENASMEHFEQNCARAFSGEFGLMLNNFQSLDPGLWSGFTCFLQDAHPWIDFPIARAIVDLFFGNYSSSFLGLHKDTQEVFGFVVRGEKTILAWPFDYFISRVEGVPTASRYFQVQLPVDYRKFRKDALVLRARAGDIIYWPSDYWHIAEGTPGRFSVMLSLGLFSSHVNPRREGELNAFRRQLLSTTGKYSRNERSYLRSQDMTETSPGANGTRRLTWATRFGFEFGGPVEERLLGKLGESHGKFKVVKKNSSLLLWKIDESNRKIFVTANGYSASLPHSPAVASLLRRVSRGTIISAGRKTTRSPRGKYPAFVASYWDGDGELRTRRIAPRQSAASWLIEWLLWVGAVVNVR